jgi:hypothetical protein
MQTTSQAGEEAGRHAGKVLRSSVHSCNTSSWPLTAFVAATASASEWALVLSRLVFMGMGGMVKEGCARPARLQQISM